MSNDDLEIIQTFVTESQDLIDDVEPILVQLQQAAGQVDKESINSIFRLFHSMKGSAAFLGMENIAGVTHEAETLLDIFRHKDLELTAYYVDIQLKAVDLIRQMLEQINEIGNDEGFETNRVEMIKELHEAIENAKRGESPPEPSQVEKSTVNKVSQEAAEGEKVQKTSSLLSESQELMLNMEITPEMAERFSQESHDLLDNAEQCLLNWEKAEEQGKAMMLSEAFRDIHSFKGNCGFMQIKDMEDLSHAVENVLDSMRNGHTELSEGNFDIVLSTLDTLREALNDFISNGSKEIFNCDVMIQFINEINPKKTSDEPKKTENVTQTPKEIEQEKPVAKSIDLGDDIELSNKATPTKTEEKSEKIPEKKSATNKGFGARRDIRVDVNKLDSLINLVGELVIAEAMVLRNPSLLEIEDENLDRAIHHLQRISSDLQDMAMSVRMVPLASTFKKMIRLVHDLSRKSGKKVNIELKGEDTEVDKNVIEQIGDPLVHIIRNAVDHGVESPEDRVNAGKEEKGQVTIEAKHEGGEVCIIISDDGKGLKRERILAKAIEKGIVDGDGADLSDEKIFSLIFEPGFSTADQVTDVSGRGVGMDVVKKNLEKLNGRVSIQSKVGEGTDFMLHIPLTLAIIDGMLVEVGDSQYTIPLLSIRESIPRPSCDRITITPDGIESIRVREEMIPIVRLHKIFNKPNAETELEKGILVVVESNMDTMALLVDEILGQQETVIKGLSNYIGKPMGISGCTVLGTGEVSLIIDVAGLIKSIE